MSGSRISVRGELVEEAKHRGADREAASDIWGLEDRVDPITTNVVVGLALLAAKFGSWALTVFLVFARSPSGRPSGLSTNGGPMRQMAELRL